MDRLLSHGGVAAAAVMLAGVVGACQPEGPDSLEVPAVPADLKAVAAEYDQPSGTVPEQAIQQIAELDQKLEALRQSRLAELVSEVLSALRRRLTAAGITILPENSGAAHGNRPTFTARAKADRICRGWDDTQVTPNPADGAIQLFAQVVDSKLDSAILGTASACKGRIDVTEGRTIHTFLDGALGIVLTGPLPDDVTHASFFMAWDGTLGTETSQRASSFDFRFSYPQIEVRLEVPDGHIIGSIGLNEITLRGTNGTFGCTRESGTCGALTAEQEPPG